MELDPKDIRVEPIWSSSSWFPQYRGVKMPAESFLSYTGGEEQNGN